MIDKCFFVNDPQSHKLGNRLLTAYQGFASKTPTGEAISFDYQSLPGSKAKPLRSESHSAIHADSLEDRDCGEMEWAERLVKAMKDFHKLESDSARSVGESSMTNSSS